MECLIDRSSSLWSDVFGALLPSFSGFTEPSLVSGDVRFNLNHSELTITVHGSMDQTILLSGGDTLIPK